MPRPNPPAWSQVIASRVTSSCSLAAITCSWVPPAERIAGILADRGIDVSGRTILRWVQKFGAGAGDRSPGHRRQVGTTWLVDETYVKILGKWHYLCRGVDLAGQVLDCWLSATRDLPAAEAFFRRTSTSTRCVPERVVTDKATFYPSAIGTWEPDTKHTTTGF